MRFIELVFSSIGNGLRREYRAFGNVHTVRIRPPYEYLSWRSTALYPVR